jgi:hypothetical protein
MTELLLSQALVFATLDNDAEYLNYLNAIVAYIVGCGLHSIHEVVAVANFALNLIPGYQVSSACDWALPPPPLYRCYFDIASACDPEFSSRVTAAWDGFLSHRLLTTELYSYEINLLPMRLKDAIFSAYGDYCHRLRTLSILSPIRLFHGNSGIRRARALVDLCASAAVDLLGLLSHLALFFSGRMRDAQGDIPGISGTDRYSFTAALTRAISQCFNDESWMLFAIIRGIFTPALSELTAVRLRDIFTSMPIQLSLADGNLPTARI